MAVALGASPLVAHAQISADVSFSWNSSPPAEAIDSTDVFYDQLSPYGVWVDDPMVGQAFIPDQSDYVPYTNGHWENTDVGFVWISDEPYAWATSHYGRWFFSNDYGRWMWIPDTTWGPNWVEWYDAGDDLGWAPLAPQVVIDAGYQMPYVAYHYCPADHLLDVNVTRYYEPTERVQVIHRQARPITYRANIGAQQVVAGPAPERLAAHHVRAEVKHLPPKQLGRLPAPEARTAVQHAQQRKPQIEQQNARRLDQHTEIKKVVEQRATKAPARPTATPTRPEPTRPDMNRAEPNRPERTPAPRPDLNRVEPNRAEPNRAPSPRPDANRAPTPRPDANRAEPNRAPRPEMDRTPRPEPQRTESTRPEPRNEPARPEPPRPEMNRVEPARPEPRNEPARPEPARPEMNRPEPVRPEPRRVEPPRAEPPRAEPPRPEPQRAEPPRPEPHAVPAAPRGHDRNDDKRR
ncbi:MAG: hypothetical protein JO257_34720 [Deltaproteobacteria bacterium]|nr:hypothetical protein [Deltaproteobacteria bacterium]